MFLSRPTEDKNGATDKKADIRPKTIKDMEKAICHDCNAIEGEYHQAGCDMERCIKCGGQLISCDCKRKKFGEIPWIQIPNICRLCGELWPDMFSVPEEEWKKFIIPELQKEMLCFDCYKRIKKLLPNGWANLKE